MFTAKVAISHQDVGMNEESIQSFISQCSSNTVCVCRYWCDRTAGQSKGSRSTASQQAPVEKKIDQLEAQDNIEASSSNMLPELCLAARI